MPLTHERDAGPTSSYLQIDALIFMHQVDAEAKAALLRPPPQLPQHEQAAQVQALLRHLLARGRADGSFAPMQYEDLIGGTVS